MEIQASGLNDGLIEKSIDSLAGETNYLYDNWKRLISATQPAANGWGLGFTYDGFGNRADQTVTKGTAIESHLTFNAANNRINSSGYTYDANGNLTQMPTGSGSATLEYDIENRLTRFYVASAGIEERYGYGPSNERVWKSGSNQDTQDEVFFYGIDGKLLGRYHPALSGACNLMLAPLGKNVYFAGKLIRSQDRAVVTDRLGTVRISYMESEGEKISNYYPFGEEISPITPQNRDKFATYYRDGTTGLDYAMNRYYSSGPLGRFLTPDPYLGSANPANPQSWNRYTYVSNNPINRIDPEGLDENGVGGIWDDPWYTNQCRFETAYGPEGTVLGYYWACNEGRPGIFTGGTIPLPIPPKIKVPKGYMVRTLESDDPCSEGLREQMQDVWSKAGPSTNRKEAGFVVYSYGDNYYALEVPFTNQDKKLDFKMGEIRDIIGPSASIIALYHTHPTKTGFNDNDIGLANLFRDYTFFIISEYYLYKYRASTDDKPSIARGNGTYSQPWSKPCGRDSIITQGGSKKRKRE